MRYYCEDKDTVLRELGTLENGLSAAEAAARLEKNGKNALATPKGKSLLRRFFEQLADPMILILLAAALVSGVLAWVQDDSFTDPIIILSVVLVNAVLGVYQEHKAEKAIEALQEMSAATSKVLRDGELRIVKSEELVVGDVILLEAGDAVPADARLLQCASLQVEESALTGESTAVFKQAEPLALDENAKAVPLGDRRSMVYMGSSASYGRGVAVVTATGMSTEMGKIAGALSAEEDEQTPLQRRLHQLSRVLTRLVLGVCAAVFAVRLLQAGSLSGAVVLDSFMVAVSLAVAAIPEGLAAVVTVVLSIGVTNMSRRNAIIRRLTAVETLGCAQVICSDKTGTLTQNRMTVVEFYGDDEKRAARAMALCSDAELDADGAVTGEPTEAALVAWAKKLALDKNELKPCFVRCGEAPFDSLRKMMSTVHLTESGCVQYTKGASDVLLARCDSVWEKGRAVPLTQEKRAEILRANKAMADRALRVLAVAERSWPDRPAHFEPEELEHGLCFLGLAGMIDPVRPEVKAAIDECRRAGIRPIMITGDHVDTASAIARELGILREGDRAVSGAELDVMDEESFEKVYQDISVYARVQPEHKTRIVSAWRRGGCVTAMTGDGVNDAPSIKSADIGVGMGITGTDVTKNVADMVLSDDNFASIVGAVEEGRRIYDNIRKAVQYLLASNMSEVIGIFTASLLGFTLLRPAHLLWVNLITDCFPALALGAEQAEADVMRRRPRGAQTGIFADGMGFDVVYQGLLVALLTLLSYRIGAGGFHNSTLGMSMAFLTLSMAEVFHSFNLRSQRRSIFVLRTRNPLLLAAGLVSLLASVLVCQVPSIAAVFGFTPLPLPLFAAAAGLALCVVPVVELVKTVERRR